MPQLYNNPKAVQVILHSLLKLTNVARASLEELRLDYEDFLRQRRLAQWPRADARRAELIAQRPATADVVAAWVRALHDGQDGQRGRQISQRSIQSTKSTYPEIAANAALALLAVAGNREFGRLRAASPNQDSDALLDVKDVLIFRPVRASFLLCRVAVKVEDVDCIECLSETLSHPAQSRIVHEAMAHNESKHAGRAVNDSSLREARKFHAVVLESLLKL